MSNTRKETCPHCDGCGYVEVPLAPERTEPVAPITVEVFSEQKIAKIEARIERQIKALANKMWKDYLDD